MRHDTRHICVIFHTVSPFSFYGTARLFKNSSFFKIGAFIIAFKRNINSRIYPTEKCREKDGVIRHIDALIWPTLSSTSLAFTYILVIKSKNHTGANFHKDWTCVDLKMQCTTIFQCWNLYNFDE